MSRYTISNALFPGFAADLYSKGQLYTIHSAEEGFITVEVKEVNYLIAAEDAAKILINITQTLRELQAAIIDAAQLGKHKVTFNLQDLGEQGKNKFIAELEAKGYKYSRNKLDFSYMDIFW